MSGFFKPAALKQERPEPLVAKCGACGLYRDCLSPKMAPYGSGAAGVLVLGEFPRLDDDEEDMPFMSDAGAFFREVVRDCGYDLEEDAISTHAAICHPKAELPTAKQLEHCRPNLTTTIRERRPTVILTLGRMALVSALAPHWQGKMGEVDSWVGWQIPVAGHFVCPTWSPYHVLRMNNPVLEKIFRQHVQAAFDLHKETAPVQPDLPLTVIYDPTEAAGAIDHLRDTAELVAVDYETNCLKPEYPQSEIVSCAMSDGKMTISYPWTGDAIDATEDLLMCADVGKVASNAKFEERWTRHYFGRGVVNWKWDTMLAAHCLDNRTGVTGLKFQSFVRLGIQSYNQGVEPFLDSGKGHYNRIRECDLGVLLKYGAMDALLEYRLAMIQMGDMQ
jgi:uracil-DNA glycosylase family 4